MEGLKKELKNIQKALLTGTSYMMPLVVAGGILFSFSLLGGDATSTGIVVANSFMANLKIIGAAGLFMMIPVLAAYIAYSIAGRPGLDVYKRQPYIVRVHFANAILDKQSPLYGDHHLNFCEEGFLDVYKRQL